MDDASDPDPEISDAAELHEDTLEDFDPDPTGDPEEDSLGEDVVHDGPDPVPCAGTEDCDGGPCAQGYCCDEPCDGLCGLCDVPGDEGHCVHLDGSLCDDDDACSLGDRCADGGCESGFPYCEGRPCSNCEPDTWSESLGDWCADLGGAPICMCRCE